MDINKIEETIGEKIKRVDILIRKYMELREDSWESYCKEIDELLEIRTRYKVCKERVEDIKVLREELNG